MTRLRIFSENQPAQPELISQHHDDIARELGSIGVRFEQWEASQPVAPGASSDEVFAAYRADIDRLVAENGFKSVDVVSIAPDNPQREVLRGKFLEEHFHKEDEVRFFVAGSGLFTLHVGDKVLRNPVRARRFDRRTGQHHALVRHGPGAVLRRHPLFHRARWMGRALHRQ